MTEPITDYNVFISWSGETSKKIAFAVQDWLSTTIQAARPFVSDKDIDAGDRGLEEIAHQLDRIRTGIICLTSQNQGSAWINYEAGAISKRVSDKTYVICLLFDMDPGQVRYPLATFQNGPISEDYMAKAARTVNRSLGGPLEDARLEATFRLTWPTLAIEVEKIRTMNAQVVMEQVEPARTPEDMFEEIVVAVREQSAILADLKKPHSNPRSAIAESHLELVNAALKRLMTLWGRSRVLTVKEVAEVAEELDDEDWRAIRTAPFLVWYLEHYYNVYPRRQMSKPSTPEEDLNDVPF